MTETDALVQVAVDAARLGGALLAGRARGGEERAVSSKSTPTDLVSEADLEAQRAIRALLARVRPDDGFLGEEEDGHERGTSGLEWVVDPLDGTVNFLFGIPQWCVSVAVRDEHRTLAGAVYDANRDELFTAADGGPAVLAAPSGTRELTGPRRAGTGGAHQLDADDGGEDLAAAMIASGLAYDADVRAEQARVLARLAPRVRDIRRFGSAALDLTWTAAGRYDAYFERSVKPWDIAAGELICRRAGLTVLELPARGRLPLGILVAPPGLAEQLFELVAGD